jgi:hypothetical protein
VQGVVDISLWDSQPIAVSGTATFTGGIAPAVLTDVVLKDGAQITVVSDLTITGTLTMNGKSSLVAEAAIAFGPESTVRIVAVEKDFPKLDFGSFESITPITPPKEFSLNTSEANVSDKDLVSFRRELVTVVKSANCDKWKEALMLSDSSRFEKGCEVAAAERRLLNGIEHAALVIRGIPPPAGEGPTQTDEPRSNAGLIAAVILGAVVVVAAFFILRRRGRVGNCPDGNGQEMIVKCPNGSSPHSLADQTRFQKAREWLRFYS